jgi:hypothetical protein
MDENERVGRGQRHGCDARKGGNGLPKGEINTARVCRPAIELDILDVWKFVVL